MDDLDLARLRFPLGDEVVGRVSLVPAPGVIGLFVDLGGFEGFVDVLSLPDEVTDWPAVDTVLSFQVVQHRNGQVRLLPTDPGYRSDHCVRRDPSEWARIRAKYQEGDLVVGTVAQVFAANRECSLRLDVGWAVAEWSGEPPYEGQRRSMRVRRLLDGTRTVVVDLLPSGGEDVP